MYSLYIFHGKSGLMAVALYSIVVVQRATMPVVNFFYVKYSERMESRRRTVRGTICPTHPDDGPPHLWVRISDRHAVYAPQTTLEPTNYE